MYLQRDSDGWQVRLQIGHEMFHRACSGGRIFHWTHEMLGCLGSVRLLRRQGLESYARTVEQDWLLEANKLSLPAMRAVDLWTLSRYPPGFYGRAFATGAALARALGWENLCPLARCLSPAGAPDVDGWLARLPPGLAASARAVLGGEGDGPGAGAGTNDAGGE